ncbi:MAG TPA: hypothetical protein VK611_16600 [Acidimicrobiales bacterium]|nr:hypothetical protein [Acidimicrobiales bacterium]
MKRTLAGVGLLAAAGLGTVILAPSSSAQTDDGPTAVELEATWSPNPAGPGEAVTLTPSEPCVPDIEGDLESDPGVVVIYQLQGDEFVQIDEVDMDEDFGWSYETTAPTEAGVHSYGAECRNSTWEEEIGFCSPEEPEELLSDEFEQVSFSRPIAPTWDSFDCKFEIYFADLTVEVPGEETPPTTAPPVDTPPPAVPVVRPPDQTG